MWSSNPHLSNALWQGAIAIVCVSLLGCTPHAGLKPDGSSVKPIDFTIDPVTIAALKQAPVNSIPPNTIVQIKGRVDNRAPLLGKTAYELHDTTGTIWVVATASIPNVGDEVVIKGKLSYQSIPLNGKEQGTVYLEQQQLLQRTPALKSDRGGLKAKG